MTVLEGHPPRIPGAWYGCEHPERPYDPAATEYVRTCRGCWLAAKAAVINGFGEDERTRLRGTTLEDTRSLAAWVERHADKHAALP